MSSVEDDAPPSAKSDDIVNAGQNTELPPLCGVTEDFEHYWIIRQDKTWKIAHLNPRQGIDFNNKIKVWNDMQTKYLSQRVAIRKQENVDSKELITTDQYNQKQSEMLEYILKTCLREMDGSALNYDALLDWDEIDLPILGIVAQDVSSFLKEIGSKGAALRLRMLSKRTSQTR